MNRAAQVEPVISGYQIVEQLYASSRTLVYRAICLCNHQPVILKKLQNEYPSFHELVQFRNQYIITQNLNLPGIIKTYDLETHGNGYVLVMEDYGGISIEEFIHEQPLDIPTFLAIAIQLSDILHELYQNRIIHKDIKPANILIHPETKQVKLIDFSISSLLPRETQDIQNPNILEGTLAYISPEQTGRMNRGIDYRSDFYSLGVTFYELLTGQLPFSSNDAMELVHCHIAKIPTFPHTPRSERSRTAHPIPLAMSEVELHTLVELVMKLMAKNAEDRYQSALGLKYDLEKCLNDWKETGKISEFVIAQQDRSNRFIIPEKLYGREEEVQVLLDAFERVSGHFSSVISHSPDQHNKGQRTSDKQQSEMILVAGFSGIGKTAVINEVHKPIVQQRGYFIKGKYDQFNRNIPFSAFVQAFRDLIAQLLGESDRILTDWKSKILDAVGDNGQVLIDVIPELEQIIGQQPTVAQLSGSAAQNRFNLLLSKFVRVFTTKDHPLVIFLDDLQWSDSASLNLLKLLMNDSELDYLLVLGAYRDHEVFPAHSLMLTLDDLHKQKTTINTITLEPLDNVDITRLVADTLLCSREVAKPLSKLVYQKTQGNPFFTTQFLQGLYEESCITFNNKLGYWQCDLTQVRQLSLTDNVVEFMIRRLQKLSDTTQNILKFAACIGNRFDLETLAVVCTATPEAVATHLWGALQEGFIIPESETYKFFQGYQDEEKNVNKISVNYRFLHDRVQQAAYSLIPTHQKQITHLTIGQQLLHHTPEAEWEEHIFDIVNQFNLGIELIADVQEQKKIAELNLIAARRAKSATAYASAVDYYKKAQTLLANYSWQDCYDLMLAIYTEATEAAYLNTDFEQMEQFAEVVLKQAQNILDQVPIYETKIQACVAKNQLRLGLDTALDILHQLGIDLPAHPTLENMSQALAETQSKFAGQSPLELIHLPLMTDAHLRATIRILSSMFGAAYNGCPEMLPLTICQQVNLSIQHGNTPLSAFAYASYGLILCAFTGAVETSYQFGQLAVNLMEQLGSYELCAKIEAIFNNFIRHWKDPLRTTLPSQLKGYQSGLDTGDLEWAVWCIFGYSFHSYCAGKELKELEQELATYSLAIAQLKQTTALNYQKIYHQAVLNLLSDSKTPYRLVGKVYNEEVMLPHHQQVNDRPAIYHAQINKLMLCYLFEEYDQAIAEARIAEQYLDGVPGLFVSVLLPFYDALAQLALLNSGTEDESSPHLAAIQSYQEKLQQWAEFAPHNHLHKLQLVEAEYCRVLGQPYKAMELYDRAIAGAKQNKYIQEEGLANELAAKFYLSWDKEKVAAGYLQEAYYCYAHWGAKAKIAHLEQHYPQLLKAILQPTNLAISSRITLAPTPMTSFMNTSSSQNLWLDFPAVLKAAQTISQEIEFDKLLATLMQIAITNAGAQMGHFIICHDHQWLVVAQANSNQAQTLEIPLEQYSELPQRLIYSVVRMQKRAVFDNLSQAVQFASDPYFKTHQPQSVLCMPMSRQGKLIGILYLENNLTIGAFTRDRIEVLNLLMSQAAISVENARLYQKTANYSQTLEIEVERKTQALNQKAQDLEQALKQLQHTQAQLIHNEKMSSLGQMVAGIAHEINNPISFIEGNISHTKTYIEDLIDLLALYEQEYHQPSLAIQNKRKDIELDFLFEDVTKILQSMQMGSDRIRKIILSLRNFSRLDESPIKAVDLHSGIESTLLIVQNRLQASDNQPEIRVVKEYGPLPKITCYPSQLNQVFLNIIANGIDAIREHPEGCESPEIWIRTEVINPDQLRIAIANTNSTIPPEIQERIFDPFFTTKPVGKGTGLGLFVSYSIIQQHGGTLSVRSQPGQGTEFEIVLPRL